MKRYLLAAILAAFFVLPARADWTGLNATGATITFKNPNACTSVACVPVAQPVDSTGASFGVTGNPFFISFGTGVTLPAYASPPTVNLGTIGSAATQATLASVLSALGSPFQANGNIGNTSFGVSGTLPGYASIPAFKIDQTTPGTTNAVSVTNFPTTQPVSGTVTANAGTNLNTSALAIETGNLASIFNTLGSVSASPIANTMQARLATINTTLGSPFQAGSPISNTSFGATQSGTWNIGTLATVTNPVTVAQSTAANLNMTCANCSGSGASGTDEGGFTAGSSVFAPGGGFFQTTATSNPLSTGQWGAWQMTANRAGFVNLRNASGTEIGTASTPVQVSVANTGANGTAMLVTGTGGTFPASQSGIWSVTATQATGTNLHMVCDSGCSGSGGTSQTDEAAFTYGTTAFTPIGGVFNSSITSLSSGQSGALALTADRNAFVNLNKVAGTALGTPAAYGSIPTGNALSVNAFITNSNANGSATSANSTPVVIASDQAAVSVKAASGAYVAGSIADLAHGQGTMAASVPVAIASNQSTLPTNQTQYNSTAVVANPCLTGTLVYIAISQATSTQVASLGGSSKKNYVCSLFIVGADAENVSIVEGTGTVCATTPSAIIGGTTAANGPNFAANGGATLGNGSAPIAAGSLTSLNNVCILQSGTGRVAGSMVLAQQ